MSRTDHDAYERAVLAGQVAKAAPALSAAQLRGFLRAMQEAAEEATRARLLARLEEIAGALSVDELRGLLWALEKREAREEAAVGGPDPVLRLVGDDAGPGPATEPPPDPAA